MQSFTLVQVGHFGEAMYFEPPVLHERGGKEFIAQQN